jgi:hypothetical protein
MQRCAHGSRKQRQRSTQQRRTCPAAPPGSILPNQVAPIIGPPAICPRASACPSTDNSVARLAGSSDRLSHARCTGPKACRIADAIQKKVTAMARLVASANPAAISARAAVTTKSSCVT